MNSSILPHAQQMLRNASSCPVSVSPPLISAPTELDSTRGGRPPLAICHRLIPALASSSQVFSPAGGLGECGDLPVKAALSTEREG